MKPSEHATQIHLNQLPSLKKLFSVLNAGLHVNRLAEPVLWAELEAQATAYHSLFFALGYDLRLDERGFAWFQGAEASNSVSKSTRQLALFFMLLFEHQADAGQQLNRFTDWQIDAPLIAALWDKNRQLLEAEGFIEVDSLHQLMDTAGRYGFAAASLAKWRLLPAVFRYLDRFEELATRHSQAAEAINEIFVADREDRQ